MRNERPEPIHERARTRIHALRMLAFTQETSENIGSHLHELMHFILCILSLFRFPFCCRRDQIHFNCYKGIDKHRAPLSTPSPFHSILTPLSFSETRQHHLCHPPFSFLFPCSRNPSRVLLSKSTPKRSSLSLVLYSYSTINLAPFRRLYGYLVPRSPV